MMLRKVPRGRSALCTGTVTLRAGSVVWIRRQWLPEVRETANPARSRARMTSLVLPSAPEDADSCSQGHGDLADARRFARRDGFAACGAILEHQANGIFGHGQGLALISPVGDDLGKRGDAHS